MNITTELNLLIESLLSHVYFDKDKSFDIQPDILEKIYKRYSENKFKNEFDEFNYIGMIMWKACEKKIKEIDWKNQPITCYFNQIIPKDISDKMIHYRCISNYIVFVRSGKAYCFGFCHGITNKIMFQKIDL